MTAHEHPFAPEDLMAYVDGELTAIERARVTAHLEQCGACRDTIAAMRQVSDDLAGWTIEPPPPMRAPSAGGRWPERIRQWLSGATETSLNRWIAATAFGVIVVGALLVGREG